MKLIVSVALLTSLIAIAAFWGAFALHLSIELARFGWELVGMIFS